MEIILYKIPKIKAVQSLEGKLGARWRQGVFLGCSRDSPEYLIWDTKDRSIRAARSVKRVPISQRYDPGEVEQINERPRDRLYRSAWKPGERKERVTRLERKAAGEAVDDMPQPKISGVRNLKITARDIE